MSEESVLFDKRVGTCSAFLFLALTALVSEASAEAGAPEYMASHGVCTDAAIKAKFEYVTGLLREYNESDTSLSEAQVNRIWDSEGRCDETPASAGVTGRSKYLYLTTDYFGSYVTANVKYRQSKLAESRYFVDEYLIAAAIMRNAAKRSGSTKWLQIDAPYAKNIDSLDQLLANRGYPRAPDETGK